MGFAVLSRGGLEGVLIFVPGSICRFTNLHDFRARINLQCFGLGDGYPVVKTVQYLVDLDSVQDC